MALVQPGLWPLIAEVFADAMAGDPRKLYRPYTEYPELPPRASKVGDLARQAVSCADSVVTHPATAEHLANATLEILRDITPRFALSLPSIEPDGACEFWPTKGREPERFAGPWNHTLAHPMLILSALIDPYVAFGCMSKRLTACAALRRLPVRASSTSSWVTRRACLFKAHRDTRSAPWE